MSTRPAAEHDYAGLGIDDFYAPLIPDPSPDVADQGDPYLLTPPASAATRYRHYLYHTDVAAEGDRIPVYGSHDLRRFEYVGKALRTDVAMSQHWAPCVVFTPSTGLYTMFYSRSTPGQPNPDIGHRLRRAVASDPEGPFADQGDFPLDLETDFAIDADVYHKRVPGTDEPAYFLAYVVEFWHEDRVGVGVVEVALTADLARPVSAPRVLVKPALDVQMYERGRSMPWRVGLRNWAGGETVDWHCIEAPIGGVVSPAGRSYYLTSFGSYKDETYAVGAVREDPDGRTRDLAADGHAVLRSGMLPGITSAGHPSLVTRNLLLSHGRFSTGGDRRAFFAPLLWDDEDRPYCPSREQLARILGGAR
jgi:arabinan endo-1,5-alpha-L-arabinosidase